VNSGDAASGYGFWTPGALHDGAMSWGFQPRKSGTEWNPATRDLPRGAWPVCGEADHGLVAGIEAARTVLYDDPDFGMTAYGGAVTARRDGFAVVPRDGVRQRLSALVGKRRLHLELDRDGFAEGRPVVLGRALDRITAEVENRVGRAHAATLIIEGLPAGSYSVQAGEARQTVEVETGKPVAIRVMLQDGHPGTLRIQPARGSADRPQRYDIAPRISIE